jgi:4-amino-4-deoxy-L-arabinose transferase-like glycosyltransferase
MVKTADSPAIAEQQSSDLSRAALVAALGLGLLLRLIAVVWGELDAGGDGTYRLIYAAEWARQPAWKGLSGVWPPLHFYFLGALIRVWDEPIFLARAVNLLCGVGALFALRSGVRPLFGETVANLSALLLAVTWTHVWLTTGYWVEMPYLLLVFLAAADAARARESGRKADALRSGLWLALAVLLRHEGMLLVGLFALWYLLNSKDRRSVFWFALAPVAASAWHFIEPWLQGRSYFDYAATYAVWKAGENAAQGLGLADRLRQIVLIPAATPSLFIVLPGLYGLWRARRMLWRDLFAWMFVAQALLFVVMTFTVGWRPQLRYVLLYFVNLYPYAALAWGEMIERARRRVPARAALAALLAATTATQAAAWWVGRNDRLPLGWLPLRVHHPAQKVLDEWVRKTNAATGELKIRAVATSALEESWRLTNSLLVNRVYPCNPDDVEYNAAYIPGFLEGRYPAALAAADVILIDPRASFYQNLLDHLNEQRPGVVVRRIDPHIAAWLLTPQARATIAAD